jgi:hypothetical protein
MARARLDGLALQGWHAHGAERAEIPGTAKIGEAKGPEMGGKKGERRNETGEEERRRGGEEETVLVAKRRSPASSAALRPPGPSRFGLRPKRKRREAKRREETDLVANTQVFRLKCSASPSDSTRPSDPSSPWHRSSSEASDWRAKCPALLRPDSALHSVSPSNHAKATDRGRLASTGQVRTVVARRGASMPRKKDAHQQLPTRSTLSRPN